MPESKRTTFSPKNVSIASIAGLAGLFGITFGGVEALDSRYTPASEFQGLALDIWYAQYYDRLDDYEESIAEGRDELAKEYLRQMEKLAAKICTHDPEWERCKKTE